MNWTCTFQLLTYSNKGINSQEIVKEKNTMFTMKFQTLFNLAYYM